MSYAPRGTHTAHENPDPPTEATGPIASDSLAADSIRSGGDFGANESTQPTPMSVKGASSTLANTDTSGAVPLHPAASGAQREMQDAQGLGPDESGHSGVKYPEGAGESGAPGTTTSEGYSGASSGDRPSEGYNTGMAAGASDFGASTLGSEGGASATDGAPSANEGGTSATGGLPSTASSGSAAVPTHGSSSEVPTGPTYAGTVAGTVASEGQYKPKGDNLTEGDIPQTKTFLGDVGGQHDPGRLAERQFEKINADVPGGGVGSGRDYQTEQGQGDDKGGFEVLESERA